MKKKDKPSATDEEASFLAFGLSDDDPANFRRKILPFVEPAGGMRGGAGHRPAALYRRKAK